jgi:hypothetical protein
LAVLAQYSQTEGSLLSTLLADEASLQKEQSIAPFGFRIFVLQDYFILEKFVAPHAY